MRWSPEALAGGVRFQAARSRGPGGQNVNKVSSAARLTWNLQESQLFNDAQKDLIRHSLKNIINTEGLVYLQSDRYRDLERNKADSLAKLVARLEKALEKKKPRKATRPTKASKIRKRVKKERRGEIKKLRQKPRI